MSTTQTIDQYIEHFPDEVKLILQKIRSVITDSAGDAVETISYQLPTFKYKGKNLVHFAAFKNHIGFYPTPSGITAFQDELSKYKFSKGSVQFPMDEPIPYDLIARITRFRVNESNA